MELIRYERPLALSTPFDEIDDVFEGPFDWSGRPLVAACDPRVDIVEEEDRYVVKADLPGLTKKDIDVKVEEGILTISGEKNRETTKNEKGYRYFERSYGKFCRSFRLPDHVDAGHIDAHYRDGVLELALQKKPETKPTAIEVKVD